MVAGALPGTVLGVVIVRVASGAELSVIVGAIAIAGVALAACDGRIELA